MPVFPKYYNPQLDQNDYRRNMMRVFRIEKNQDNNTDYTSTSVASPLTRVQSGSTSGSTSNNSTPGSNSSSSVGKYEENLDSEISSIDEKITVLENTLNEVDDDMTKYKDFYDSAEFTTATIPVGHAHAHVAGEKYMNTNNAAALQRIHRLDNLQLPIESKVNRSEGLLGTILNQYKSKISGKHLNRFKKEEWIKIQQTFNKLFESVQKTLETINIYKTCINNKSTLAANQNFHYHNPPDDFGHRLETTLDDFQSVLNSDKNRYSYNLGKY